MCSKFIILSTEHFQFHINFFSFLSDFLVFPRVKGIQQYKKQQSSPSASHSNSHEDGAKPHLYCCVSDRRALGRDHWSSSCSSASHLWPSVAVTTATIALCSMEATGCNCRCHHQQTHALLHSQPTQTQRHRPHTPGTGYQKRSVRVRSKVDPTGELLSPYLYHIHDEHCTHSRDFFQMMDENPLTLLSPPYGKHISSKEKIIKISVFPHWAVN